MKDTAVNGQMSAEEIREALPYNLRSIAQAYPEEFFTPLTAAEREAHENIVTRASGAMGRHLGKFLAQAADEIDRLNSCLSEERNRSDALRLMLKQAGDEIESLRHEAKYGDER